MIEPSILLFVKNCKFLIKTGKSPSKTILHRNQFCVKFHSVSNSFLHRTHFCIEDCSSPSVTNEWSMEMCTIWVCFWIKMHTITRVKDAEYCKPIYFWSKEKSNNYYEWIWCDTQNINSFTFHEDLCVVLNSKKWTQVGRSNNVQSVKYCHISSAIEQ